MKRLLFFLITLFVILISPKANAASYTWTGLGGNSNWNNPLNWGSFTNYPVAGDDAYIYFNLNQPIVNVASACKSLNIYATTILTLSASLTVSGGMSLNNALTVLTFAGTGSASIAGTSNLYYNSSLIIGANNTITFPASSVIAMAGNNINTITNNGTLNLTSNTLTFGYLSLFYNNGILNSTSSTMNFAGNNNVLYNAGTVSATSSTFNLNSQYSGINNTSTFTASSCTFSVSTNYSYLVNTGNFTVTSSPITLSGQGSYISNTTLLGVFKIISSAVIIGAAGNYANITNGINASFTINAGSSITISSYQGYISNTGYFYAGTSNSACPITVSAQGAFITNFGAFYVGSTSGINLTAYQGVVTNNTGANFTFQSDANGSAYVGAIPTQTPASANGVFTGTFNVERYITGGSATYRGYRLFSSPVYAATVGSNNVFSLNYIKNNSLTTGNASGGFDKTGNPSFYLNREDQAISNLTFISGNFWGVSAINNTPASNYYMNNGSTNYNIPVGNGFLFWFRGDRTTNLANKYKPGTVAESVTMSASGTLNTMQVIVRDWYTPASANLGYTTTAGNTAVRGFNMVGNPYASSIDWENFQSSTTTTGIYGSNVGTAIYMLNPKNQNYGVYLKGSGGVGTNSATNVIASGQGFFVAAANASAQLIFNESAKTTAQNTGLNLFMATHLENLTATNPYLRLQIGKDTADLDDILLFFKSNAKTGYAENEDAIYRPGFGKVSLSSLSSDSVGLAVNVLPLPKTTETIKLAVTAKVDTVYQLSMKEINQVPQLYDIWLVDAYKKDSLDMRNNSTYSFNVYQSDSASFGSKRFSLVIRQNPAYAYHLLNFTADKVSNVTQVLVNWKTENEQNYTNFTVQRSTDNGKTFEVIGSVPSNAAGNYSLIDKAPAMGQNLYRLQQTDINNAITYSKVVLVAYANTNSGIAGNLSVYPNPANTTLNLSIDSKSTGAKSYDITIASSTGLVIKQITTTQATWQGSVSDLMPGTYMVKVVNNTDKTLAGSSRFVKL